MSNLIQQNQTLRLPFSRLITAYLCLASIYFISILDVNSVATALPAISKSLGGGNSITWTGTAYVMGQTAFQALYGRLSDIFGRKPVLMACIGSLIIGDVLCGFARNVTWLYVCRALSGIGGGGISSLVQITASDLVSLKKRGKYQGILSCAIGLGASTGPFVTAGLLSTGREGWRWVFWVPPMLAAVCMAVMWVYLPLKPVAGCYSDKLRKIDWFGLVTVVNGVLFVLIPINSGGSIFPWNSALVITLIVVGAALLVLFVVVEIWIAKIPMIPLRLFKRLSTTTIYLQSALYNGVWQIDLYFLPIYFQDVRSFTPLQSALYILPLLLTQSIAGIAAGQIMSRLSRPGPVIYGGLALWLLGAGLKVLFSRTTPIGVYVISLIIEGAGVGFILQPALVALQALSNPEDRAVATSTRNLMRMLGSVFGLAISTTVSFEVMKSGLPTEIPASLRDRVIAGTWERGELGSELWESDIMNAKLKGLHTVFIMLVPIMALCLLSCIFIPNVVLKGDPKKIDAKKKVENIISEQGIR
ncbi:major facilitator superfamily domain-containing protein [Pseudomassariella vexata]|uniref:Major facilitator superfamily domain-containing protein n=1 Tax=Pseudomassariella vexata TaxID=1141098 RepID=A0A1Y2DGQ5_9PEZI|nr:major facilitator superfamily domain-containing protein [Pseudomassariella vexata]ORY57875.1 major facilitator superfamily domain-containing protein [Pseudomassariella vexata]